MKKIYIQTAQNMSIHYEPAGLGDRIIANVIDTTIVVGLMLSVIFIFSYFRDFLDNQLALFIIFLAFPRVFYHLISEISLNGQSIGKRQRKIKIIRLDGTEASISNYLLRWLIRPVDMFLGGIIAVAVVAANGKDWVIWLPEQKL